MKVTQTHDNIAPTNTLIVLINSTSVALAGEPGWAPKDAANLAKIYWTAGAGVVDVFDEPGKLIGTAPMDSLEDFQKYNSVYLLNFDGAKYEQLGERPLLPR